MGSHRHYYIEQANEKLFNITNYQRKANQNHKKYDLTSIQTASIRGWDYSSVEDHLPILSAINKSEGKCPWKYQENGHVHYRWN